jgi:hypothetical protein
VWIYMSVRMHKMKLGIISTELILLKHMQWQPVYKRGPHFPELKYKGTIQIWDLTESIRITQKYYGPISYFFIKFTLQNSPKDTQKLEEKKFSNYYKINKIATEKFNTEIIVHMKHFKYRISASSLA